MIIFLDNADMSISDLQEVSRPPVFIYRRDLFEPSETFIAAQARALEPARVVMVGGLPEPVVARSEHDLAILPLPQRTRLSDLRRADDQFRRLLMRHRPRLVHAHFATDAVYALAETRRLNIPLVTTLHGFDATASRKSFLKSRNPVAWNYAVHRSSLFRYCSLFLCVSEAIRDAAVRAGFPGEKLVVHRIGIDARKRVLPGSYPREQLIVHVARLVEKKGTDDLLKAFRLVRASHPAAKLVIIGDGPLRHSLQCLADRLGIRTATMFAGSTANEAVLDLMRKAAVVCVPSKTASSGDQEGLPTVIMEAMATATPVVATRHSGIPEVVAHEQTGRLVDEGNYRDLASALIFMLSNEHEAQAMGLAGRMRVLRCFDIVTQSKKLSDLYDSVVDQQEYCNRETRQ